MERNEIIQNYSQLAPLYNRLASELKPVLKQFLDNEKIDYFDIECRVKDLDSVLGKVERKGYENPFEVIPDICGLRIIAYYTSDLDRVLEILSSEFEVIEINDKQKELEEDRFGYISHHFVGKLKSNWLNAPNYRGLDNLKFEIQVRTVLMHGWAAISHKLSYKHEKDVPRRLRRDLFRLSALIELADEQFDRIRKEREEYSQGLVLKQDENVKTFDSSGELNVDSLQALLNFYFPERKSDESGLSSLVNELQAHDISLDTINHNVLEILPYLEDIEKDEIGRSGQEEELPFWAQSGALRTIMDLTIEDYFNARKDIFPQHILETKEHWSRILNR